MQKKLFHDIWKDLQDGKSLPMLRYLGENKIALVFTKVHQGTCGSHIGGRELAHKLLNEGCYWPILMKDIAKFIKKTWQMPKTWQPTSFTRKDTSFFHITMAILPMGHLHPRTFPIGTWPTEVCDCWRRLLHKMDKSWSCIQNRCKKGSSLLLAANHVQVQFTKSCHFK